MTDQWNDPSGKDEAGYDLLVPFVACASEGGPYDDDSFVAGVTMQGVWDRLAAEPPEHQLYAPPRLVPQLDLVAMHYGYSLATEPYSEGWTHCRFTRAAS